MSDIPNRLAEQVEARAQNRCEYCQLSQLGQEAKFHIDHVIPKAAGGPTSLSNLALACVSCSLRKGARRTGIDPATMAEVGLYNPRTEIWNHHFQWEEDNLKALTPTGRATTQALALNRPLIVAIRREEMTRGRHPPA